MAKYDGTAKGGIIFNLKHNLNLPVLFLGVGETLDDLEPFDVKNFIEAFFTTTEENE